jgi:hypothetical protein
MYFDYKIKKKEFVSLALLNFLAGEERHTRIFPDPP